MDETKTTEDFPISMVPPFPLFSTATVPVPSSTQVIANPTNYVTKINTTRKFRMRPYFVPIKRKRTSSESKVRLDNDVSLSMMDTSCPYNENPIMEISLNSQIASAPSTNRTKLLKKSKSMEDLRVKEVEKNPSFSNFNEMEFMSKCRISLNFPDPTKDVAVINESFRTIMRNTGVPNTVASPSQYIADM